jgi:hypothetical protein
MQFSLIGSLAVLAALGLGACTTIGDLPAASLPDASLPSPDAALPTTSDAGTTAASSTLTSCAASTVCTRAPSLGSLSGDTDGAPLPLTGSRAAWFRIRVTEDDLATIGHPLSLLATLTTPPGSRWEVLLYVDAATDATECLRSTGSPVTVGDSQQIVAIWGEGPVNNSADDSRDVAIEIRAGDASCNPAANWKLTLQGNPAGQTRP